MPAELEIEVLAPAQPYWEAFGVLSQGRTVGGGMTGMPNPLAVSEIVTYAAVRGLPMEETVTLVQHLDRTWLELVHAQLKAGMKARRPDAR